MASYNYLDVGMAVIPSLDELLAALGSTTQTTATLFERTIASGAYAGYRIQFTGTDFTYAGGQPYSGHIMQFAVLRPDNVVIAQTADYGVLNRDLHLTADVDALLEYVLVVGSGFADRIISHGYVQAGGGNDTITGTGSAYGDDGDDMITGSFYEVSGGRGNDTITGSAKFVYAGDGNDTITGNFFMIEAGAGNDTIIDSGYRLLGNTFDAGDGDDFVSLKLTGNSNIPRLVGGAGQDILELDAPYVGTDVFSGFETLRFGAATPKVSVQLRGVAAVPANLHVDATAALSEATFVIGSYDQSIDLSQWTFSSAAAAKVSIYMGRRVGVETVIGSNVKDFMEVGNNSIVSAGGGDDMLTISSYYDFTASGGDGNDIFNVEYQNDLATITLSGDAGDDLFRVTNWAARIDGGTGTDLVGFDRLEGGISVTLNGDTEVAIVGTDARIKSIEGIIATKARDSLIGDGRDNSFSGREQDDLLQGKGGKDTLDGGSGNDIAEYSEKNSAVAAALNGSRSVTVKVGGAAEDIIRNIENLNGGAGFDVLTGDSLNNGLSGNGGGDLLAGKGGNDSLDGGAGDDRLSGDDGDDALLGGSGDDKFGGGAGKDAIDGGAGSDTAFFRDKTTAVVATLDGADVVTVTVGGTVEDSLRNVENLTGGAGADRFTGDGLANILDGSTGNDTLDGKAGADTMIGGLGNDTFTVDNVADKVVEANGAGTGTDSVVSSVGFSIASQFVENLLLTGSADIAAFGNNLDNVITGNAGANALTGYLGKDLFLFRVGLSATKLDTIRDFSVADDTIGLGTNIFTQAHGLRADGTGTLLAGEFRANTTGLAQDGDDRIIYETDTGNVFYDANGNAAGGSYLFAKVGAGLALTNADFLLV